MKILLKFLVLFFLTTVVYAKRLPAPEVPKIVYHGVSYSALYTMGGVIEAHSVKTKQLLWRKQIYRVNYNPRKEQDVQDIFIKEMTIKQGWLLIKDEQDHAYRLNLITHQMM